jgi:DNA-binding NarL/FixJ family response regulator
VTAPLIRELRRVVQRLVLPLLAPLLTVAEATKPKLLFIIHSFSCDFMVATEASLLEGAARLNPAVVVLDLSLSAGNLPGLLRGIGAGAPGTKVLVLSVHDERTVADSALAAGADAVLLKRCLATDLMPAIDAVLAGQRYVSQGIAP